MYTISLLPIGTDQDSHSRVRRKYFGLPHNTSIFVFWTVYTYDVTYSGTGPEYVRLMDNFSNVRYDLWD